MVRINEDFKKELKRACVAGLEESVAPIAGYGSLAIKESKAAKDVTHDEFILLTISAQAFRVFLVMQFDKNSMTENLVSNAILKGNGVLTDDAFYDYIGELGNAFCGAIKRDLTDIVQHLGMSTPNRLSKDCLPYLIDFETHFEHHIVAEINEQTLFNVSLYLNADHELDYEVNRAAAADLEVETGELEMF